MVSPIFGWIPAPGIALPGYCGARASRGQWRRVTEAGLTADPGTSHEVALRTAVSLRGLRVGRLLPSTCLASKKTTYSGWLSPALAVGMGGRRKRRTRRTHPAAYEATSERSAQWRVQTPRTRCPAAPAHVGRHFPPGYDCCARGGLLITRLRRGAATPILARCSRRTSSVQPERPSAIRICRVSSLHC